MIRVSAEGTIDNAILAVSEPDAMEEIMENEIVSSMVEEIKHHFDEIGFIELTPNEIKRCYEWKAEFNICSTQEEQTVAQLIVQRLLDRNVSAEDIEYILEPLTTNNGGW